MILKGLPVPRGNQFNPHIIKQLLLFVVFAERFPIVASVNVIITKELLAGTPNRRNRTRIAIGREELRVATGKRLIGGAVVPSTPGRKELISSMFYFNRCVKGRRFAGVPVSENPGVLVNWNRGFPHDDNVCQLNRSMQHTIRPFGIFMSEPSATTDLVSRESYAPLPSTQRIRQQAARTS